LTKEQKYRIIMSMKTTKNTIQSTEVTISASRARTNDMTACIESALKMVTGKDYMVSVQQLSDTAVRVVVAGYEESE
jgi:hypothetical protein